VAAVFNSNPEVIATVTSYMAIVFPSYLLLGVLVTVTNSLNALHKPLNSMALSILRMFVLYVPLAFAGSSLLGLTGVWWAALTANATSGALAVLWFRHAFGRMKPEMPRGSISASRRPLGEEDRDRLEHIGRRGRGCHDL